MNIKMTNETLMGADFTALIMKLDELYFPGKTQYWYNRVKKKIVNLAKEFEEAKIKILEQYGEKQPADPEKPGVVSYSLKVKASTLVAPEGADKDAIAKIQDAADEALSDKVQEDYTALLAIEVDLGINKLAVPDKWDDESEVPQGLQEMAEYIFDYDAKYESEPK